MDIGCGDGQFVLDQARRHPDTLCVGIDASCDAMRDASRRAASKPSRGGVPNALFLCSSLEQLPAEFCRVATRITINYPWGSLLAAVVKPDIQALQILQSLARPDAEFTAYINYSVFEDEAYAARIGLPKLDLARAKKELPRLYQQAGLKLHHVGLIEGESPVRTTWGQKLTKASQRKVLMLQGIYETHSSR